MSKLIITIECSDPTDLDWLYTRCVGPVVDAVAEAQDEGRMDGTVEVNVERDDD